MTIEPDEGRGEPQAELVRPGPDPARPGIVLQSVTGNGDVAITGGRALASARLDSALATTLCGMHGYRCYAEYAASARVRLVARPAPGFAFAGWSGSCTGTRPTCSVLLTARRSVSAAFAPRKGQQVVRVELQRPRFQISWQQSTGIGKLILGGKVSRPTVLQIQLRRPHGGPLVSESDSFFGGSFRIEPKLAPGLLPPGAIVLPGGFSVLIAGRSGRIPVLVQLRSLILPAPAEGVVERAYASTNEKGAPVRSVAAGSKEAHATFVFAAQPRAPLKLTVSWYQPGGRLLGSVVKSNRPTIASFIRSKQRLPAGTWVAVLRAGKKVVKQLSVRVAEE